MKKENRETLVESSGWFFLCLVWFAGMLYYTITADYMEMQIISGLLSFMGLVFCIAITHYVVTFWKKDEECDDQPDIWEEFEDEIWTKKELRNRFNASGYVKYNDLKDE